MRRPYLIAESPQVTVLRSLASTAFGKVNVTLPEGVEMDGIFTPSAPGNELGYVAALDSKKRVGGMFRRFVRADVSITAKGAPAPASDVEQVLDEAAKRTSGEFFLESDITLAGLGDWVPLQDFHVGDLVDVEIWGMVVPMRVTRIEPIVSDHSVVDWRVHVGGQLVSDEDALLAANATIHRVLVEDRRDLAGLSERVVAAQSAADAAGESARVADGKAVAADSKAKAAGDAAKEADDKAVAAQATADDADGKAKKLAEALSGGGATIPTVMADLQRLNKQLQQNGEGGAADQGLIPAYIAANTKRWELQEKVDKQQDYVSALLSWQIRTLQESVAWSQEHAPYGFALPGFDKTVVKPFLRVEVGDASGLSPNTARLVNTSSDVRLRVSYSYWRTPQNIVSAPHASTGEDTVEPGRSYVISDSGAQVGSFLFIVTPEPLRPFEPSLPPVQPRD